ncbi:lymphatic vessel endothelial hyaluronic acid receptor 1a isoform X2 [Centropristis striata]|uniref:lymphatic vessel endothelial hyaluronic acid receptor 1a isoform X1 n=1 Tax=Centropristis striata TaxID=184440 RepID=UPI0027E0A0F0|nr:lymphatic vessel endothelial hyaluronic acid receptor 1a isoform X1 [Centropristis striata]XP_059212726.1 lymphatic vessel endothelial hyaluronic acid receptor 1a isoform X2 [Centropristis striata]
MKMILLCIVSVLVSTPVFSGQKIDRSRIRMFPAANRSIAGVFQVSSLNYLNQPQYAFNASDARQLCSSLGVSIASKAQVQDALDRGLETCRFGWIDEHFAVVPRIHALSNCGKNEKGLVPWRASVTRKFDVFCFNETDAERQLKDTTTEAVSSTRSTLSTSSSTRLTSSSSTPKTLDNEVEPARFVSTTQSSTGGKAILIISTCALLLVAIIILVYVTMRRSQALSSEVKKQQEFIQTEEWTCVKEIKETTEAAEEEEERIEVDDEEAAEEEEERIEVDDEES